MKFAFANELYRTRDHYIKNKLDSERDTQSEGHLRGQRPPTRKKGTREGSGAVKKNRTKYSEVYVCKDVTVKSEYFF